MKRHSFLLLLIAALMLLASCGQLAANSQTTRMPTPSAGPTAISADYAMLSGYGQDVLPLYESTRVTSCSFTLRFSGNEYTYGHATYQIQYESDALAQDALDCYRPVFTRVGSNYEDMIMGQIGGRPSNVSVYQEKGEPLDASLILGLTDEEEPAGNPYFDNYSAMVEVMGGDRNTPDSFAYTRYNNDYVYGERCDLNYLTTLTAEEFSDCTKPRTATGMNSPLRATNVSRLVHSARANTGV